MTTKRIIELKPVQNNIPKKRAISTEAEPISGCSIISISNGNKNKIDLPSMFILLMLFPFCERKFESANNSPSFAISAGCILKPPTLIQPIVPLILTPMNSTATKSTIDKP